MFSRGVNESVNVSVNMGQPWDCPPRDPYTQCWESNQLQVPLLRRMYDIEVLKQDTFKLNRQNGQHAGTVRRS